MVETRTQQEPESPRRTGSLLLFMGVPFLGIIELQWSKTVSITPKEGGIMCASATECPLSIWYLSIKCGENISKLHLCSETEEKKVYDVCCHCLLSKAAKHKARNIFLSSTLPWMLYPRASCSSVKVFPWAPNCSSSKEMATLAGETTRLVLFSAPEMWR